MLPVVMERVRVLLVDDEPAMGETLELGLRTGGFEAQACLDGDQALTRLGASPFDVVVTDLNMRGMNGLELCKRIVERFPDIPVIVLTAFGSLETAVGAIRAGAYDFLSKPVQLDALKIAVARAAQHRSLRTEVRRLRKELDQAQGFGDLTGQSPAMVRLYEMLARVADSDVTVLITGESGTGKELVARALHRQGKRQNGPFVAINCAAMPESLLESELFGHAKGAFTDARTAHAGLFVQASGGTLFLDEIGDMPLGLQGKLLRALQERTVRPVGSTTEVSFDTRIVAATHRDLEAAIEEKTFREDLYYRLNVIPVELPPLRARGGDVLLLAQRFLAQASARAGRTVTGLDPAAAARLQAYPWPGNVRELQNAIERAVALTRYDQLTVDDLPPRVVEHRASHVVVAAADPSELVSLEEVERRYIARVLESVGGNKTVAARILGLDRTTLYRKLERIESARS